MKIIKNPKLDTNNSSNLSLIKTVEGLKENLSTIESYLGCTHSSSKKEFALALIQKGKNIIAYKIQNELHFAPSRFMGYKSNTMESHNNNHYKHGGKTTPQINRIIKNKLISNSELKEAYIKYCRQLGIQPHKDIEDAYKIYCNQLGIQPHKNKRKYWLFDFSI